MKHKISGYIQYFINLLCPALLYGAVTGVLTATVVALYKFCAGYVIEYSEHTYTFLRENPIWLPAALTVLFFVAWVFARLYRSTPNLKGGGIPTAIGIVRGRIPFKWFRELVGVFALSMTSFFIGVPLGNEGPAVQMGTMLGRAGVFASPKKHKAWDRYAMTGGACSGFATATGSPLAGILFAVEEAHQTVSPMIIMVAVSSVTFSQLTITILAPLLGISAALFPHLTVPTLPMDKLWIPLLVGVAVGLFAVVFLRYYRYISTFFNKTLSKIQPQYKVFFVFVLTLATGLWMYSCVSTGHHLIEALFEDGVIWILVLVLIVRTTLTLSANSNGITGGLFIPIMALGAVIAAIVAKSCVLLGMDPQYYTVTVVLGITACVSGMMKTPITAFLFSIEALACGSNILPVIIAAGISYAITEIFSAKSITDMVLENRMESMYEDKEAQTEEIRVTVQSGAFAVGKQIRDILWPANLLVLSVQHNNESRSRVDVRGDMSLRDGDVLHIRYSTYNDAETREQLFAIIGDQQ